MHGMTHAGGSPASIVWTVCGVFRALIVVLGVVRAELGAEAGFFRGVCGSLWLVESGKALAR